MQLDIRKELFWDLDFSHLDEQQNKNIIIERVLNFGDLKEFKTIVDYYGAETIKDVISNVGYLDPKTLEFVVSYFNLKKENLRCYTKNQLHQPYWD